MTELFVMAGIANNLSCSDKSINMEEILSNTHVTKAAISQMFTSLEKRGYIVRETDKSNRRKITVELTESGNKVVEDAKKQVDKMLEKILSRFGEKNTWQLIALLNQLSDISDDIKRETIPESGKEDFKI